MKVRKTLSLFCAVFMFTALLATVSPAKASVKPLISVDWVKENLDTIKDSNQQKMRLIQVSSTKNYRKGHIPGAGYMQWGAETFNPLTDHLVQTLPQIERVMSKFNVNKDTHIILYDGDNKPHHVARVYWTLKFWNFENVSIVDGGKFYWQKTGNKLSKESPKFLVKKVDVEYPPNTSIRAMYSPNIINALATKNAVIVDARPAKYYNGETYSLDKWVRSGHIKGAVNVSTLNNVDPNNLTLKKINEMKANFESKGVTPDKKIITYCDTGVLAAHAWFVLHEILGYENVAVYDASMREFANRFDTPMEPGKVYKDFPEVPVPGLN